MHMKRSIHVCFDRISRNYEEAPSIQTSRRLKICIPSLCQWSIRIYFNNILLLLGLLSPVSSLLSVYDNLPKCLHQSKPTKRSIRKGRWTSMRTFYRSKKCYVGDKKSYVGVLKCYVGLYKSYVGDKKSYVGVKKSYVGLYKSYVGDKKSYVGDKKSYVGV